MARLANWQNNLSSIINERREVGFDFAHMNCMFWVADVVKAITGDDFLAAYRGKFKTEKGAAKLLRKLDGVDTSQELLIKRFGPLQPISFARMGDIVLVKPDETELDLPADLELFGPVPGICYGTASYFLGYDGLVEFETLRLGQAIWVS